MRRIKSCVTWGFKGGIDFFQNPIDTRLGNMIQFKLKWARTVLRDRLWAGDPRGFSMDGAHPERIK